MKDNRQQIITFIFTDIQGSTQLARSLDQDYPQVLATYREVIRKVVARNFGLIIDSAGDGFFITFKDVLQGVRAAGEIQAKLARSQFPKEAEVLVRIGIHTGFAVATESGYTGLAVHKTSRICDAAHGGQVLLSYDAARTVEAELTNGYQLENLGRYQLKGFDTPEELFQLKGPELKTLFPAPRVLAALPVIAVLPFLNQARDQEDQYFCEGLSTDIIHSLSRVPGLRVVARSASCVFRSRDEEIVAIGRKLKANGVLHGVMLKSRDKLELTVELTDVDLGQAIWSSHFKTNLQDIFSVQDEITKNIANAYGVEYNPVNPVVKIDRVRPQNIEAYDFYLKGRRFYYQFSKQSVLFALEMFQQAMQIDPDFALAYAGAADCYSYLYMYDHSSEENRRAAEQVSIKAIELCPASAEAHASRGVVLSLSGRFSEAETSFEKAISLDPQLFEAYFQYARVEFASGNIEKAAGLFRDANRIRPEDYQSLLLAAQCFESMGLSSRAREVREEGIAMVEQQLKLNPGDTRALYLGANGLAALGEKEKALIWLHRALTLEPDDAMLLYNAGCIYALVGMIDESLESLERSIQAGLNQKSWFVNDPDIAPVRHCTRFKTLLQKLDGAERLARKPVIGS
ncbi:MAG: tetratricopeptide repeat protein [Saprospiraceae bacterium]|nr:tetratricopeptide repeat protein [Saprospiraceae bacterium]